MEDALCVLEFVLVSAEYALSVLVEIDFDGLGLSSMFFLRDVVYVCATGSEPMLSMVRMITYYTDVLQTRTYSIF